jgi:hypothetical protein
MKAPRKIHIASRTYQRNWAVAEKVFCTRVGEAGGELRPIEQVGYRARWWGQDPELAAAMEAQLGFVEDGATAFLRDPAGQWPTAGSLRGSVATFIAVHVVRSPGFRAWYRGQTLERVATAIDAAPSTERLQMRVAQEMDTDRERAITVLQHVTYLASLLASMHWSLVKFDGRVLALSDQPVCVVPAKINTGSAPLQVVPDTGFVDILEVRVPVAPERALIMTWRDTPEASTECTGTFEQACNLNASTVAQADRHWFRHPDGIAPRLRAPTLEAISEPISPQILPGYNVAAARRSRRRLEAMQLVYRIVEQDQIGHIGWVSLAA